jgi:hypothetical protein
VRCFSSRSSPQAGPRARRNRAFGATFPSAADFKAPARQKITERGYTILLSMGDQESDLKGGYAERVFKLPNPVYFLP